MQEHPIAIYAALVLMNALGFVVFNSMMKYGEARRLGWNKFLWGGGWHLALTSAAGQLLLIEAWFWPVTIAETLERFRVQLTDHIWLRFVVIAFIATSALGLARLKRSSSIVYGASQISAGLATCWAFLPSTDAPGEHGLLLAMGLGAGLYLTVDGVDNFRRSWLAKPTGLDEILTPRR